MINLVITQARTGSTRLPGKTMKKILGKEMILRFVDRVLAAKKVDNLIVATTVNPNDDCLVELTESYDPRCTVFRGSEADVLDRYYQAAKAFEATAGEKPLILRITSDCPLIDPAVIDLLLDEYYKAPSDYLSNRLLDSRSWPHGMDVEIFTFQALEKAWKEAVVASHREHVTSYILESPQKFSLREVSHDRDLSAYRVTVDFPEDLEFVRNVFTELFEADPKFSMYDIISLVETKPELYVNRLHAQ